jgi:hypothetical protein
VANSALLIRHWQTIPPRYAVGPGDLVVLDLADSPEPADPERLRVLIGHTHLYVVVGSNPIQPVWLALLASGAQARIPITIVECGPQERSGRYRVLVSRLLGRLRGPSGDELAQLVLQGERFFAPAEALVRMICRDPWGVRRPRDLAAAAGMSDDSLRGSCGNLGFTRVEHFMTAVRIVALELLVRERQSPLPLARRLVGISSPTNARRQLQRARRRSARAFRKLQWLVA